MAAVGHAAAALHAAALRGGAAADSGGRRPPLAYVDAGKLTGFCVEITREIQRRIGDRTEIGAMPWARSSRMSLGGDNVVILCPRRTPERESQYQWVGPLHTSQTNFYARRGDGVHIASLDDARKLSGILVQREYYSQRYLLQAGFVNLETVNSSLSMLNMVMAGRRPVMVLDEDALPLLLQRAGVDGRAIESVHALLAFTAYIAFPQNADAGVVARWRTTLEQIHHDGTFARMEQHWFGRSGLAAAIAK